MTRMLSRISAIALLYSGVAWAAQPPAAIPASVPALESSVARQGHFYAGGRYVGEAGR